MLAVNAVVLLFTAVNEFISPVPVAASPILGVLLTQV